MIENTRFFIVIPSEDAGFQTHRWRRFAFFAPECSGCINKFGVM